MPAMNEAQRVVVVIAYGIAGAHPVTITYAAKNGMLSTRSIIPSAMERCKNGQTIVRAWDLHREDYRSFTLRAIQGAEVGSLPGLPSQA